MKYAYSGYVYILITVVLSTYGQVVLKWQMSKVAALPEGSLDKALFLTKLIFQPWIFSSFLAAFLASLAWMAALTKFELSFAYPFMSLSFVLVFLLGVTLLNETLTATKLIGTLIIFGGLIVLNR
ncbi:MAG: EamA family transporter [Pseudomonadota bacterium]